MVALTVGMPTYNDFDGVYFTVQALRLYQDMDDTEIVVVDNFGCEHTRAFVEEWSRARYILATDAVGTAAAKNRVFAEATGEAVLCMDSHVRFFPGAIARLKSYFSDHPETRDLLQGPLVYDDLKTMSTSFDPVWRGQMWGIWATDPRGLDPDGEPFEIWGQGMGVFSCRRDAWPGFHPDFRGFGGEEGYIHEKVRQHGGRVLCLPWLRWVHRFGRPAGVPYNISVEDKFRNYLIGHIELGLDPEPVVEHFSEHLSEETIAAIAVEVARSQIATASEKKKKAKNKKGKKRGKDGQASQLDDGITLASQASETIDARASAPDGNGRFPLVSCICSTYNRPPGHQHLLEEAIESFLRQDYPNKELIVLNDCPGQELVCDAPGVRVINIPERFPTLGEKHNAAIALARGDLIAIWDDDDISLPWRLSLSVDRLGDADYFNPKWYWIMVDDKLQPEPISNIGHNLSLYRRTAFEAVGRYPSIGSGVDVALEAALRAQVHCVGAEEAGDRVLTDGELYYVYRWGVSPTHLSMAESDEERLANYSRIGLRPVKRGRYILQPHWRKDYVAETRRLVASGQTASSFEESRDGDASDVRIGVLAPTHNRPSFIRALVTQLALQEMKPDVVCVHQNGDPKSYQWAIADLELPFTVEWMHTPEKIAQCEWYSRPLKHLLDAGCTHFFWCDDDDLYFSSHIARGLAMLTNQDDPRDFVVNGYSGVLLAKKSGYEYEPCNRFSAHDPGGMSSSMAFNRAFAEELFLDLGRNQGALYFADQVVRRVTMPKFRCKLDERQSPSTVYFCHSGADSSSHWLGET